ncbi:MAG: ABC-2 transporter permease [Micrococcales bacterium]|nr:ABC-2 transporter permease [Micrococcales bacterium]
MNRVVAAARLEAWVMKSSYPVLGAAVVVPFLVAVLTRTPVFAGTVTVAATATFVLYLFAVHEKNRTCRLYGIVPLHRRDVVAGRYLYALVLGVTSIFVAVAATGLASTTTGVSVDATSMATFAAGAWLALCYTVAATYPVYFVLDFSKGVFITPLLMLVLVAVAGVPLFSDAQSLSSTMLWLLNHPTLMALGALAAGLTMLTVSALVATALYQRKELT